MYGLSSVSGARNDHLSPNPQVWCLRSHGALVAGPSLFPGCSLCPAGLPDPELAFSTCLFFFSPAEAFVSFPKRVVQSPTIVTATVPDLHRKIYL